jgi:1-acyl-sn-glycerol-3-phosphate acyltransferase
MIRTVWVYLNILISVIVVGGVVVIRSFFPARGLSIYDWATRDWSRWILRAAGVDVEIEGLENVRLEEPQIFASNHVSWFDVWALAASIPKRNRFVAKKELEKIPLFGRAWKAAGHISVDRGDRSSAIRSLQLAGDRLHKDNISVVIYPEGTRSRTGKLGQFKKGAFMLALQSGVEIVPVAVLGTRAIMPAGAWRIRPGRIILRFGEPVRTSDYTASRRDELIVEVRHRIKTMLAEPVGSDRDKKARRG